MPRLVLWRLLTLGARSMEAQRSNRFGKQVRRSLLQPVVAIPLLACSSQAPRRAQLLVIVDTNAPLVGQVLADPTLSPDAAIDTVRIDVLDVDGKVTDSLDVLAPDPLDWPISFGVKPSSKDRVRLRIRAFRARFANSGEIDGRATLEPPAQIAIDRAVDIALPASGKRTVRVLLDEDCLGRPAQFLEPATTCVDAHRLAAPLDAGVEMLGTGASPKSVVGTWKHAHYVPCVGSARSGRVCVPGGFAILGDPNSVGLDPSEFVDSWPPLPVLVSSYWMDKTEFTVGRYRQLLASGAYSGPAPVLRSPGDPECSWLGAQDSADDNLALSCVTVGAAAEICKASGGLLPSEAQWEYEARGRGQDRVYPWGDAYPQCCTASVSRHSTAGVAVECNGTGPEPVGSHLPSPGCQGLGDESRDGVLDLGGGVSEFVRGSARAYDDSCWGAPGIVNDPVCQGTSTDPTVSRGGNYSAGRAIAAAALRIVSPNEPEPIFGFRCVYPDGN